MKQAEREAKQAERELIPKVKQAERESTTNVDEFNSNSILSVASSSILRNGLYNGEKFYFHAGIKDDKGATAGEGEAPSFNFRTEDGVVYTLSRWSQSFIAMDHDIRGAARSSKLFHGAGRDTKTKRLNGLGQHSKDDCCVLVFTVAGKTTAAAVQFLEETTVNKKQLKVEFQNVINEVKRNWQHFDDIILPWFKTTKHYVAVGLGRDNQNGHIKLNIPTSVNTKGHFSKHLEENSLKMNQISCTVSCPILCRMIEHVNHRENTRIQFYSKIGGFMPLHQDCGGERAHEYIKCSYMETGVGLTYSK